MIFVLNHCLLFYFYYSLLLILSLHFLLSFRLPWVNAVDVWDGTDMPVVCHGNTLTTKIAFCDVIAIIAEYAFDASKYVQPKHRRLFQFLILVSRIFVSIM